MSKNTKSTARKTPSSSRKPAAAPPLRISKHPLFAVVVIHADGSETIKLPCVRPVAAAQYIGGYNSGQAAHGEWAEGRELDLDSIRFTGRKLEWSDVREESKSYKMNLPRTSKAAMGKSKAKATAGSGAQ